MKSSEKVDRSPGSIDPVMLQDLFPAANCRHEIPWKMESCSMRTQASCTQRTFNRVSCGLTEAGIALSAPAIRVVFRCSCSQAWDVHLSLTEESSHDKPKWSLAQRCTYSSYSAFPMSRQASYNEPGYLLPWHCSRPTAVPRTSVLMLIFDSLACSTRGADGLSWQQDISQLTLSLPCVQAVVFFLSYLEVTMDYDSTIVRTCIQLQKFREERFL